jgi:lysyl-tRNA synthetase class 2
MNPENRAEGELTRTEVSGNKALELTEDEKLVLNLLKARSPIDLNALKDQTGLSNKKWDKAIKGLTKNKLAKVEKTDDGLFVTWLVSCSPIKQ